MLPFFGAYIAGKKSAEGKQRKEALKEMIKDQDIEDTNKRKSDSEILDELLKHDSRKGNRHK